MLNRLFFTVKSSKKFFSAFALWILLVFPPQSIAEDLDTFIKTLSQKAQEERIKYFYENFSELSRDDQKKFVAEFIGTENGKYCIYLAQYLNASRTDQDWDDREKLKRTQRDLQNVISETANENIGLTRFNLFCGMSGKIEKIADEVLAEFPASDYFHIGIGRSASPVLAFITAITGEKVFSIPLTNFRSSTLSPKKKDLLFLHFDRFLPKDFFLSNKNPVFIDYSNTGESAALFHRYFNEYLNLRAEVHQTNKKAMFVLYTRSESGMEKIPDDIKGDFKRIEFDEQLDLAFYQYIFRPFAQYQFAFDLEQVDINSETEPLNPENQNRRFLKMVDYLKEQMKVK